MIIFLSAVLSAQSIWDDPAPTGRWAGSTSKLASELLPPEMAANVISHVVERGIVQGGPPSTIRFTGRPVATGDGFCARRLYHVSVTQGAEDGQPQPPTTTEQIRHGSCGGLFANVNPGATLDDAKKTIRWIEWAQGVARSTAPLPFILICHSETAVDRCDVGARAALVALPLDKVTVITKDFYKRKHYWTIAVTETQLGQLYWDVQVNATPGDSSIDMTWKIPAPF